MRVTVVRPGDLGADEASLWAGFQQASPATRNPFLSLTFAQVVGRFRPNARVAVVEDDGRIEAFVAFELTRSRIGLPIGYPMNNLQGFVSRGTPVDARRVVRKAGLRGWRFVAAPAQQHALAPHHYDDAAVLAPLIDLTDGYKPYYLGRSKKLIQDTEYRIRTLERRVGPVRLEWGTSAAEHVRRLIEWKTAKYGGARELFADPDARRIVAEFAETASADCGGLVNVLRAGEREIAIVSGLTYPGVLSGWFTAYDQDMRKFAPGTIALLATAEEAARRDITRIDMGAGQDDYKSRLANASYPVAGGAVWAIPGEHAARRIYRRYRGRPGGSSAALAVRRQADSSRERRTAHLSPGTAGAGRESGRSGAGAGNKSAMSSASCVRVLAVSAAPSRSSSSAMDRRPSAAAAHRMSTAVSLSASEARCSGGRNSGLGRRPWRNKPSIRPWRGGWWRGRRPAAGPPARR